MGWQESRATLISANAGIEIERSNNTSSKNGPEIVSFQNHHQVEHSVNSVYEWLLTKGFQLSEDVGKKSVIVEKDDIHLKLYEKEKQLSEITATFTLSKETQFRCSEWKSIIVDLCEEFDLVLFDLESMMKRTPDSLVHVLSKTRSWQELQVPYSLPQLPPA